MYIRGFLHVYNRLSIYICSIFKIPFPHVLCCTSLLSHVCLIVTLWAVACHTPLSIGFPTRNTGVSCHFLLQGFFPTQGSNPYLIASPALEADFLPLSHKRSPFPIYVITKYSVQFPMLTVGPCWLSILYMSVYMLLPNSQFIPPPTFFLW